MVANQHQQPIRLVRENRHGREEWLIVQDQANQRDDSARIIVTREQLRRMAEIAKGTEV